MTESVLDRKFAGHLSIEKAIHFALLLIALALCLYRLGPRPYHHDESIHAFFSWKITQAGVGDYKYDPVYHGPVLYYSTALVLRLFGDNDYTGRLSAVFFGLGVLAFAWPLRRYLGRWGAIAFLALLAFSPGWIYFTRFVRHDIYLALCNLGAVFLAFRYGDTRQPRYLYAGAASLALAFCTKEDNYALTPIFLVSFAGMLVWEVLGAKDRAQAARQVWGETTELFRRIPLPLLTSGIVFTIIWLVFYTSFFQNPAYANFASDPSLIIKPTRDALKYWLGQHEIKRIGGPWWYYAPQVFFYDPLLILPLAITVVLPVFDLALAERRRNPLGTGLAYVAVVALVVFIGALWSVKTWAPLALLGCLACATLARGTEWVPDRFARFAILWAFGALSFYAWAQEKVPWLLVPQLLPLALVAGRWFGRLIEGGRFRQVGTLLPLAPFAALTLWGLVAANYLWDAPWPEEPGAAENPPRRHAEMLAYVQSTYDINKVMARIEEVGQVLGTGTNTRLAVGGDATWPLSWYLRHYPVNWAATVRTIDTPVVIVDKKPEVNKAVEEAIGDTYEKVPFQIRGWWEPAWTQLDAPKLVRWLLTRETWNGVGSSDAVMYVHRNLAPGMTFSPFAVNPPPPARGYPRGPDSLEAAAIWGGQGNGRGQFNEPRDLDVDANGNVYVVDSKNHRVQKFGPSGEVLAVWGGEGAGPGQFKDPCGLAVAPDGSVYVADTWNHRIQRFDANGAFLGQRVEENPALWGPRAVAVAADGTVFVADTGNKRILVYSGDLQLVRTFGSEGSKPGDLIEPVGLAVNDAGELVVADTGNHRLQFFQPDGTFLREWPVSGWEEFYTEPYIDVAGPDVYATDSYTHRFVRYRGGDLTGLWGKTGSGSGDFNRPIGIAVAAPDTVWIADTLNHRIQKFVVPAAP
jgi:uncharacterized protein (TIGR03663 family)